MSIIKIEHLADDIRLDLFALKTDRELKLLSGGGVFLAESPNVVLRALNAGIKPIAFLCEEESMRAYSEIIDGISDDIPVFFGKRELFHKITGYKLSRGITGAFLRPEMPEIASVADNAENLVMLHDVVDASNVGAIFRSAAALGVGGVVVSGATCDPLNRRAVRVSMGTVFQVPWTRIETSPLVLKDFGFSTIAMALSEDSVPISELFIPYKQKKAILMGAEGPGLPSHIISAADHRVCIPMQNGVDSLNVAAAAAIAIWELTKM